MIVISSHIKMHQLNICHHRDHQGWCTRSWEVRPAAKRPPPHVQRHPARCHPCGEAHCGWGWVKNCDFEAVTFQLVETPRADPGTKGSPCPACFFVSPFGAMWYITQLKMGMSRIQNVDHPTKFIDEIRWGLFILDMKLDCQPLSAPGASVLEMMITWRTSTQVATFVGRAGEPTFSWEGYLCHQ